MIFLCGNMVYAQNTKVQESKRDKLEKEIKMLDKQLKDNAAKSSSALANLSLIRNKIEARKKLLVESDNEIASIDSQIEAKEKEIQTTQARLDTLSLYYSKLVKSAYKNRDSRIWYMYILASDNLGQAARRFGYLKNLSQSMNDQAKKVQEVRKELEEQTLQLEEMKKTAVAVKGQRQAQVNELAAEENSSQQLVNQLNKDKKKYQAQIAQKKRQVEALNREISRLIAQAAAEAEAAERAAKKASSSKSSGSKSSGTSSTSTAKKTTPSKTTSTTIDTKLSTNFAANKGKLPWPAEGSVVDHYGQHYHPVYKNVKLPFNSGVTIAVPQGSSVKAVFDGVVKQIVVMPGYNQCVLVQHGTYFTFYCKLGSVSVKSGDKVKIGQKIGTVDTIDGETQLHFQLWSGRNPQDPELWLR